MQQHVASAFLALAITACSSLPPTDDHVDIHFDNGCWGGCPLWNLHEGDPIATGARAALAIANHDRIAPYTVSAGDPAVVDVLRTIAEPPTVVVLGGSSGAGSLVFVDADGVALESPEIRVHDVASLAAVWPESAAGYRLMNQGSLTIYVEPRDADGRPLFGYGAVDYATTGGISATGPVARVSADEVASGLYRPMPEQVLVTATDMGLAIVEARAMDATLTIEIEVVDESSVTRIDLSPELDVLVGDTLRARAFDALEREIHGIQCSWDVEAGSAPVSVRDYGDVIVLSAGVESDTEVYAEVTCTIGAVSATTGFYL